METLIVYTDLHHGPNFEKKAPDDVAILGSYALQMQQALGQYARLHQIRHMRNVGDRSSFGNEELAREVAQVIHDAEQTITTDIGNHDPYDLAEALGFETMTRVMDQYLMPSTRLISCHLDREEEVAGVALCHYGHDAGAILEAAQLDDKSVSNRLLFSHWAFDRTARGYPPSSDPNKGYIYIDNLQGVHKRLSELQQGFALSVHGHEHRFRMCQYGRYTSLVLPSMVQEDIDDRTKPLDQKRPCGLFAEISENPNGEGLRVEFKKITLATPNDRAELATLSGVGSPKDYIGKVTSVDECYMRRYERPMLTAA